MGERMAVSENTDVVVVGAGIIGAAVAFELGKRGYRTLNVDRLPAAGYGPTSNSCAIVRGHYSSWDGVAMARESFSCWRDWDRYVGVTDDLGMARYVDTGVVLIKSASGHHAKALRHYRALGIEYEEWTAAQLVERFPIYSACSFWPPSRPGDPGFWDERGEDVEGAIFTPDGGYVVDPLLATHNLQRAVEAQGGEFRFRAEVVEIRRAAGRVRGVTLRDGTEIDAQVVVNVAGPHSDAVNRLAGVDSDMNVRTRPLRHEVHQVPAPPGFDFEADGVMTSDGDQAIYFRPAAGNHILVGSEDPTCDTREWVDDPDDYNRGLTEAQWEAQVYRLARRIPSLRIPTERVGVVDLYDVSDDWIPIYDKSSLPGFYMAIGTSGNQFKNAPVAGHLMAELIDAVEHGHDHDGDPVRVIAPYTKVELDAGFYSRQREVNPHSSFSVAG
jgi:sarcosine oxidase subunit beta